MNWLNLVGNINDFINSDNHQKRVKPLASQLDEMFEMLGKTLDENQKKALNCIRDVIGAVIATEHYYLGVADGMELSKELRGFAENPVAAYDEYVEGCNDDYNDEMFSRFLASLQTK